MKTLRLSFPFFAFLFIHTAFAQKDLTGFMTPRDMLRSDTSSNINLHNNRSSKAMVYGLYVRQYAYVTPGNTCATATPIYSGNVTAGAYVSPVTINAGKDVAVGSNYLYNMILQAIYYENIIISSNPPGCALPGCTWGSDTLKYNWCIYLGALAPVSNTANFTANVPPPATAVSGMGYNYDLINNYVYLGPISCNDQTLSCTVANQQTQSFS